MRFFPISGKSTYISNYFYKNRNYLVIFYVFIYVMRNLRDFEQKQTRHSLLFFPSFIEGLTIDPLIF